MAVRTIVIKGDEILRKKCKTVKKIDDRTKEFCKDLADTMEVSDGVGLAAPQVGVMKRIFVAKPDIEDTSKVITMINPEIFFREGTQEFQEGCLSVPGYIGTVERPEHIKVRALDLNGVEQEYDFSDFGAVVISHENDHLDGILYIDIAKKMYTEEEYANRAQNETEKEGK